MIPPVDNWDKIMVVMETIVIKIVTILKRPLLTWYMHKPSSAIDGLNISLILTVIVMIIG